MVDVGSGTGRGRVESLCAEEARWLTNEFAREAGSGGRGVCANMMERRTGGERGEDGNDPAIKRAHWDGNARMRRRGGVESIVNEGDNIEMITENGDGWGWGGLGKEKGHEIPFNSPCRMVADRPKRAGEPRNEA